MNKSTQILLISILFLSSLLCIGLFKYNRLKSDLDDLRYQLDNRPVVLDGSVRTNTVEADGKDISSAAADAGMLPAINDGKGSGKTPSSFTTGTVQTPGSSSGGLPSDHTEPLDAGLVDSSCDDTVPPQSYSKSLNEPISDDISAPIGSVSFITGTANPWSINIFPRSYSCSILDMNDPEGRLVRYMKMSVEISGKSYDFPVSNAITLREPFVKTWKFNPRLGSSIFLGVMTKDWIISTGAGIGMNLISYGYDPDIPEYYFLKLGVSYEFITNKFGISIYPISLSLKDIVPFMRSTYFGVGFVISSNPLTPIVGINTLW